MPVSPSKPEYKMQNVIDDLQKDLKPRPDYRNQSYERQDSYDKYTDEPIAQSLYKLQHTLKKQEMIK